jgi:magnesium transporter
MRNELVDTGSKLASNGELASVPTADLVDVLNEQRPGAAAETLERLPEDRAVRVLDKPELDDAPAILAELPDERAARLISEMSADRAADVLAEFARDRRESILAHVDPAPRASLVTLLGYSAESAGGMMTTEFVSMPSTATVGETLDHIRTVERDRETVYAIYLLEPDTHRAIGTVSLRQLVSARPDEPISPLSRKRPFYSVSPETDREKVAFLISRHDLLAIPVVDSKGLVLGIVTVDDVIDAIIAESTEDVQKFGGVEALGRPYMQIAFGSMVRKRAGWLSVLFLSEMLTASVMQHFQSEIEKAIVLTLFIPLIMSSGGNSGSQSTSLIIRALALGQLKLRDWRRVAFRELPTGIVLGAILGLIGLGRIAIWQSLGFYDYGPHWELVAATVGAGLVGIVTFGSVAGSMLPFLLQRLGFDPASASAPFVATLVDVTGLVIYFSVALAILSGTLL